MLCYIEGDIFLNKRNCQSLAQSVNICGVTGGGISGGFNRHYPNMTKAYKEACSNGSLKVGGLFFWKEEGKPSVYNLAGQDKPGASARYEWIEESLKTMLLHMDAQKITSAALPAIGSGIGGLEWKKVKKTIEGVFESWPGSLYVYDRYVPNK